MSRYQTPKAGLFFLHFLEAKKNIENTNIPLFQNHNVPLPCSATQGFCAATLERRERLRAFQHVLVKVPTPLLPSIATAAMGPKAIPHILSSGTTDTAAGSDILCSSNALVFTFKSHTFLKTES